MSDYFGQTEEESEEIDLDEDVNLDQTAQLPSPPVPADQTTPATTALAPADPAPAPPAAPRGNAVVGIAVGVGFLALAYWLSRELAE